MEEEDEQKKPPPRLAGRRRPAQAEPLGGSEMRDVTMEGMNSLGDVCLTDGRMG